MITKSEIKRFLKEDAPKGDATCKAFPLLKSTVCEFEFISKSSASFILAGSRILEDILKVVCAPLESNSVAGKSPFFITYFKTDGASISKGEKILKGKAIVADFLLAERLSLNIMQHLSGIATSTNAFVKALSDPKIKILDTRKTIPGIRKMQKYAVKCGGGANHRFSLSDMIMIKDNHIQASGGIEKAIESVLALKSNLKIEVECESLEQVKKAVKYKIDVIMLDNMSLENIKLASKIIRENSNISIEVSGGVSLLNIANYRGLDIDFISVGALTHSVSAVDISANII